MTAATGSDDDAVAAPATGAGATAGTQKASDTAAAPTDPVARWLGGAALVVALLAGRPVWS